MFLMSGILSLSSCQLFESQVKDVLTNFDFENNNKTGWHGDFDVKKESNFSQYHLTSSYYLTNSKKDELSIIFSDLFQLKDSGRITYRFVPLEGKIRFEILGRNGKTLISRSFDGTKGEDFDEYDFTRKWASTYAMDLSSYLGEYIKVRIVSEVNSDFIFDELRLDSKKEASNGDIYKEATQYYKNENKVSFSRHNQFHQDFPYSDFEQIIGVKKYSDTYVMFLLCDGNIYIVKSKNRLSWTEPEIFFIPNTIFDQQVLGGFIQEEGEKTYLYYTADNKHYMYRPYDVYEDIIRRVDITDLTLGERETIYPTRDIRFDESYISVPTSSFYSLPSSSKGRQYFCTTKNGSYQKFSWNIQEVIKVSI